MAQRGKYDRTRFKKPLLIKKCEFCNEDYGSKSYENRRFCSVLCKVKKQNVTGSNNPNYKGGKTACIKCGNLLASRYTTRKSIYCKSCWVAFHRGENHHRWKKELIFGKFGKRYPECKNCHKVTGDSKSKLCSSCYRGKLRPQWKGGISKIQNLIRISPENRLWIKQCMYRDNYKCVDCFSNQSLQVDHITPFSFLLNKYEITSLEKARDCVQLWDIDNGRTLCKPCHKKTPTYGRKAINYHG